MLAGYARPGQTGWQLLASFDFDLLLDFAYGELVKDLNPEQRAQIDQQLAEVPADGPRVEFERANGEVVEIDQARLSRIRANARSMANRARKGQKV